MKVTNLILKRAKEGDRKVINQLIKYVRTNEDGSDVLECYHKKFFGSLERDDIEYIFDYHFSKTINYVWWNKSGRKPEKFKAFILNLVYKGILSMGKKSCGNHLKTGIKETYLAIKRNIGTIDVDEFPNLCGCKDDDMIEAIDAEMRYRAMLSKLDNCKFRVKAILTDIVEGGMEIKELSEKYSKSEVTIRNDIKFLISMAECL